MVSFAGTYYGEMYRICFGVNYRETLSRTILNVVVDLVVDNWVSLVAGGVGGMDGWVRVALHRINFLYTGNGLVMSTDPEYLQGQFWHPHWVVQKAGDMENIRKKIGPVGCRLWVTDDGREPHLLGPTTNTGEVPRLWSGPGDGDACDPPPCTARRWIGSLVGDPPLQYNLRCIIFPFWAHQGYGTDQSRGVREGQWWGQVSVYTYCTGTCRTLVLFWRRATSLTNSVPDVTCWWYGQP